MDRSFVSNYFRQRENVEDKDDPQVSIISLHSNSLDDPDKSVQFVNEETATREIKQIGKMNHRMAELKLRYNKLELHVDALQKHIIQHQNDETTTIEVVNATDSVDDTRETLVEVVETQKSLMSQQIFS